MLTTRDQCVVRTVCGKLHCLRLRTKEESCRLFIQMMGDDFDLAPKDVKKLAEETVGRCGGLATSNFTFRVSHVNGR